MTRIIANIFEGQTVIYPPDPSIFPSLSLHNPHDPVTMNDLCIKRDSKTASLQFPLKTILLTNTKM